jgi:alkanesulfonate monooxygenase SsuD/methylene tetrahydromethanopterin reductase-like flavin-dependent oxidoreductase (luciferase family)
MRPPDPVPGVYFGGSSAAAGPVAARYADWFGEGVLPELRRRGVWEPAAPLSAVSGVIAPGTADKSEDERELEEAGYGRG